MLILSNFLFLVRSTLMVYNIEKPARYEHFLLAFIDITMLTFNSLRFQVQSTRMVNYLERPVRYEHFLLAFVIFITMLIFNSLRFLVRLISRSSARWPGRVNLWTVRVPVVQRRRTTPERSGMVYFMHETWRWSLEQQKIGFWAALSMKLGSWSGDDEMQVPGAPPQGYEKD